MGPDFQLIAGEPTALEPGLQLVLAPNPSPMTGPGTNTYLLGEEKLAIIDPGPDDTRHLEALLAAIGGRPVSHIIVTHSHLDHSPLARVLAEAVHAPVLGFGDTFAGRSAAMAALAESGMIGGGEGLDTAFKPDEIVGDGDVITGTDWSLDVLHTPGHLGNHIALKWNDATFVGDLVMGWSTSLVSPPDGDMTDFLTSCARVRDLDARVLYSGHGAPILQPHARLTEVISHREERASQILAELTRGPATVVALVDAIYRDLDPRLKGAAGRNVLAHLIDLTSKSLVSADDGPGHEAIYSLTSV